MLMPDSCHSSRSSNLRLSENVRASVCFNQCLSDLWTATETSSPITFPESVVGLHLPISFQIRQSYPLCALIGQECRVEKVGRIWTLLFFRYLQNYFCHFSDVQTTAPPWMPSRRNCPEMSTINPIWNITPSHHSSRLWGFTPPLSMCAWNSSTLLPSDVIGRHVIQNLFQAYSGLKKSSHLFRGPWPDFVPNPSDIW